LIKTFQKPNHKYTRRKDF